MEVQVGLRSLEQTSENWRQEPFQRYFMAVEEDADLGYTRSWKLVKLKGVDSP